MAATITDSKETTTDSKVTKTTTADWKETKTFFFPPYFEATVSLEKDPKSNEIKITRERKDLSTGAKVGKAKTITVPKEAVVFEVYDSFSVPDRAHQYGVYMIDETSRCLATMDFISGMRTRSVFRKGEIEAWVTEQVYRLRLRRETE